MCNSAMMKRGIAYGTHEPNIKRVFHSFLACMYSECSQLEPDNLNLEDPAAYPAPPDGAYGREKLFSGRLFLACNSNCGMQNRVAGLAGRLRRALSPAA